MKDAGIEAALGRLGPLEAKLGGLEGGLAPAREALKRLEARLEALAVELAALRQRPPRAEIGQVLGRLAALEAASQAAPERLAERLAAAQAGLQGQIDALRDGPFAEIAGQLTRLYGQKDAAVETVLARLQPLEAKLAAIEGGLAEPRPLLDRFAEQLEAVQGRVTALEGAENPFCGDIRAADPALRAEGRRRRDGAGATAAAGGEARRAGARAGGPAGAARPVRGAAGGGAGARHGAGRGGEPVRGDMPSS